MKLIILDRDGVINHESRAFIKSPEEWIPIPGSIEAIAKLSQAGYTITLATNQSGLGRGYFTLDTLNAIHNKMINMVEELGGKINKIYYCPHLPDDGCNCRKPKTGMLDQLEQDFQIDLTSLQPTFIGDSLRDMQLALAKGCKFFLVTGPYGDGHETLSKLTDVQKQQITIADDLASVVNSLLLNLED
jgi:D-glycero-D-manno-heptose 1,7-bisphosphate phosphatase